MPKSFKGKQKGKGGIKQAPHNLLWGLHAVRAALKNPERNNHRLFLTQNAANKLFPIPDSDEEITTKLPPHPTMEIVATQAIDKKIGGDAIHQGVLLLSDPLPEYSIQDILDARRVAILDQVTDPHNVGAIIRSAAVFGIEALIMTQRNSPPLSGVLAKSASGGLEHVKIVKVNNLAQALRELKKHDVFLVGLDSEAPNQITTYSAYKGPLGIVLGAEDKGLRQLTKSLCDDFCHIATRGHIMSLNVSNAGAIAFHLLQAEAP